MERHSDVKDEYTMDLDIFLEYVAEGTNLLDIIYREMEETFNDTEGGDYNLQHIEIDSVEIQGKTVFFNLLIDYEFELNKDFE